MDKKEKIYKLTKKVKITEKNLQEINSLMAVLSPGMKKINLARFNKLLCEPLLEVYLLCIGERIIGMASVHYMETLSKKSAWIEDAAVLTNYQGKGLGNKIMKYVIDMAKKKGVEQIELTSSPERIAANKLYPKLDFKRRKTNVYRLKI